MRQRTNNSGFTLAELLVAVWVMSIILAAMAALSFALGSANSSADNTSDIYSRIRYTTVRVNEIAKTAKLICANFGSGAAIWRADDNGDNQINPGEIIYLEGSNGTLEMISFQANGAASSSSLTIANIANGQTRTWLGSNPQVSSSTITLINNCSDVSFTTDQSAPFAKRLNIFFSVTSQRGFSHNYQITATLRCYADYLLDASGQIDSADDDI